MIGIMRRMFGTDLEKFLHILDRTTSPELLGLEKARGISWASPGEPYIHPALLDDTPDALKKAYGKYRDMDDGRYAEAVRRLENERIGGIILPGNGQLGSEWIPPMGSELFKLGECPQEEKDLILAYFVLIANGRDHVLEQWTGRKGDHLRLLGGRCRPNRCFSLVVKEYLK